MKKILLYLIGLLFTITILGQTETSKTVYEDLGVVRLEKNEGVVSIGAFITIEEEYIQDHVQNNIRAVKQEVYNKKKYEKELEPEIQFHYEIYFVSRSIFYGDTTSTWVDGLKLYIDGKQILTEQSPEGFMVSVKTTPTLVHTHHSKYDDVAFNIEWDKMLYEPRIRK